MHMRSNPLLFDYFQYPNFGEDDLQTIVQMGLGQNPSRETALQPQSFHGKEMRESKVFL